MWSYVLNCWPVTVTVDYVLGVFFLIYSTKSIDERKSIRCSRQQLVLQEMHCSLSWCQTQRLARQTQIKVCLQQEPVVTITKRKWWKRTWRNLSSILGWMNQLRLCQVWWKTVSDGSEVEVTLLHEIHGLAGKALNKSKPAVKDAFLNFVDANSHQNGRQAGSYSPQLFYVTTYKDRPSSPPPPKPGQKDISRQRQNCPLHGSSIEHKQKLVEVCVLHLLLSYRIINPRLPCIPKVWLLWHL